MKSKLRIGLVSFNHFVLSQSKYHHLVNFESIELYRNTINLFLKVVAVVDENVELLFDSSH